MLKNVAAGISARSLKQCGPIIIFSTQLHDTATLRKSEDPRRPIDCPETKTEDCITLKPRICSPTDPPVRPCSEQDCPTKPRYSCCVSSRIADNICEKPVRAADFKRKPDKFMSMWGDSSKRKQEELLMWNYPPECCPTCPDLPFDTMYYRPSNKCRKYQRTWWECCPRMVPKRVCCWCDALPPETPRRCLPLCPRSACTEEHERKRIECANQKAAGCPRQTMPCCRAARIPPSCSISVVPKECVKAKCPFPSYSECDRMAPAVIPERPPECHCLNVISVCEAYRRQLRMERHNMKLCPCPPCRGNQTS